MSDTPLETAKKELKEAVSDSHEVLCSATTAIPLFPNTITVDRAKLNIIYRPFFKTAEIMSIRIEDILNVTANVGPVFGSLIIVSRIMSSEKPFKIHYLWRSDALKIKKVMQGYIIAIEKDIDLSEISTKDLAKMLNDLGKDDHDQ